VASCSFFCSALLSSSCILVSCIFGSGTGVFLNPNPEKNESVPLQRELLFAMTLPTTFTSSHSVGLGTFFIIIGDFFSQSHCGFQKIDMQDNIQ
jgi:hypothetical protein